MDIRKKQYCLCQDHFSSTDFKHVNGQRRVLNSQGVVPSVNGPIINDLSTGLDISPIPLPRKDFKARHVGLLSSEDYLRLDDDDDYFEFRDVSEIWAETDSVGLNMGQINPGKDDLNNIFNAFSIKC
jgi:hypothetical protein